MNSGALDRVSSRWWRTLVQQPAGRPQKPQSAETRPEPRSRALLLWSQFLMASLTVWTLRVCVQFEILPLPTYNCVETNMHYIMCGPHLICLSPFFASLITRANVVLVSGLWMFFLQLNINSFGLLPPTKTPVSRGQEMALTLTPTPTTCLPHAVTQ